MDESIARRIREKRTMVAGALTQAMEAAWQWYVLERDNDGEREKSGLIHYKLLQLDSEVRKLAEAAQTDGES